MNGGEFWKQCVQWLVNVGALPRNHKTCYPEAVVFDLAQTLRDGVVLCNAFNILDPGIIDEAQINFRPQMSEFLCMQNIRVVINVLKHYRIPPSELFEAQDLYQMTNFGQVLRALSYLSNIPSFSSRYQPFAQKLRASTRHRNSCDEEDIYKNLPELASERALADEDEDLYDSVPEEKEEGIYGSLIADFKRSVPTTASQRQDKRGCCIHEIVETENNYVGHLDMMVEQFMRPLRGILSEADIRSIFINIEQLRPIHTDFRNEIVKLQQSSKTAKFSQPFIQYREKFLIYGDYCSSLVDAQDYLDEIMKKNENIRIKIEECQINSSRNKFRLRELLCVPMQRILKYHLLVKELNKHTPDTHEDKRNMTDALTSMQELSMYINEVKRDSEELIKINQIESRLEEYIVATPLRDYGRVRFDGELKVKFLEDKKENARSVFLFDKALFLTKLRGDSYILKDLIRLEDMQLGDVQKQKKGDKWSWGWKLDSLKQGVRSYMLFAKTETDKAKWMEAFKDSADNICPRALKGKKHNFEMQTFAEPTTCSSCKLLLKGIFYQGYECSVTNARCHKQCLADTLKLIESNSIGSLPEGRNKDKPPPVPERGKKRPSQQQQQQQKNATVCGLSYKAHREYIGIPAPPFQNAQVITFQIGQPIEVMEQVTPEWWKGKSFVDYEKIGFFPASFVSPHTHHSKVDPFKSLKRQASDLNSNDDYHFDTPKPCPSSPEQLRNYYWYAGEIDRGEAQDALWDKPSGTFLVRRKNLQELAISLKYQGDVKHIKIKQTNDNLHYVAECKNFRSVQELISFYQSNSLSGFFLGLETTLRFPFRDPVMFPPPASPAHNPAFGMRQPPQNGFQQSGTITIDGKTYEIVGQSRAKFDFEARSEQELSLRAGQRVNIISRAAGAHGWWKGELNGRVGYFPTTFVEE